jgi:hypothetical protein
MTPDKFLKHWRVGDDGYAIYADSELLGSFDDPEVANYVVFLHNDYLDVINSTGESEGRE